MRTVNRRVRVSCLLSLVLILSASQSAFSQTPSCIKAWVNGVQLQGVTSFNPVTYSNDYCIDSSNAIGYIGPGYWYEDLVEIEFWSAAPIASVSNLNAFQNDCQFLYASPAESSWGQFTGQHSGYIDFWFWGSSSTMAYGTAGVNFVITDQNGSVANPSGRHVCPPGDDGGGLSRCVRPGGPRKGSLATLQYTAGGRRPWDTPLLRAPGFGSSASAPTVQSQNSSE